MFAEAVAEALKGKTEGKRVLLVRAKGPRDVLPIELRKSGAKVDVAEAYETHCAQGCERKAQPAFFAMIHRPDIVTFTSSSTATNFLSLLEKDHYHGLREIWLASIGPVTSDTLRQAGFQTEHRSSGIYDGRPGAGDLQTCADDASKRVGLFTKHLTAKVAKGAKGI